METLGWNTDRHYLGFVPPIIRVLVIVVSFHHDVGFIFLAQYCVMIRGSIGTKFNVRMVILATFIQLRFKVLGVLPNLWVTFAEILYLFLHRIDICLCSRLSCGIFNPSTLRRTTWAVVDGPVWERVWISGQTSSSRPWDWHGWQMGLFPPHFIFLQQW